jgi:hypothetical protein
MVAAFVPRMDSMTTLPFRIHQLRRLLLDERPARYAFHCSQECSFS